MHCLDRNLKESDSQTFDDKYLAQDDTITTLEKYSTGSNYQLQSNDVSDDSKTGLMHDQSCYLR
jgi:hypothetical protein